MQGNRHGRVSVALLLLLASCGKPSSPASPSPVCSFEIAASRQSFTSDGGTASVTISTTPACAWTAAAGVSWIAVTSSGSGTGSGTATFAVSANGSSDPRSGSLSVAGHTLTVTQTGRVVQTCAYALSPGQARFGKDAVTASFAMSAPDGCAWQAESSVTWLAVTGGREGTGNGTVAYAVERNGGAVERTAHIRVADQTFTVTQEGDTGICSYSVDPWSFAPCMAGSVVTSSVRTAAGCSWTVTSSAGWLSIEGPTSGSGTGSISARFADNYDAPREALLLVRWPTPTAGQNIRVSQAGCRYAVSRPSIAMAAAGGSASFDVLQQSEPLACGGALQDRCVWTATADVSWIVVTSGMPRAGDGSVSLLVAANSAAASRTGRVIVRDKTVTITQAGQ